MTWLIRIVVVIFFLLLLGFGWVTYQQAHNLVHHPKSAREAPIKTPQVLGLQVQEVQVVNSVGHKLYGYFGDSKNGAYIMLQHGFKANTSDLFEEAVMLQKAGYGVLLTSIRAHGKNDGVQIHFGVLEMDDLQAWYEYLLNQGGQPQKIGILGNSLGASMAIGFAAQNSGIAAVVSVSGFSSLQDTIDVSVEHFTGLPAFPFAPAIASWAEIILDLKVEEVDTTQVVAGLCDTPIFIMQGGADTTVSVSSGQWLYDAACGEKEFWFEDHLKHVEFDDKMPEEFARRVVNFFDKYLL